MRRLSLIAALIGVPTLLLGVLAVWEYWPRDPPPPLAAPRAPLLPDLTMAPIKDAVAAVTRGAKNQSLLFSASVANRGPGQFLINSVRGDERGQWRVSQRFEEPDGTLTETATPADMTWGGHGHEHWHVKIGAAYRLYTLPALQVVRALEKVGYCFFDQKRFADSTGPIPKAPRHAKDACNGMSALAIDMGLSPGWQDPYTWALPDQRLSITGLPDGMYRLVATADPNNWFRETDESNNTASIDVELTTSTYPPRAVVVRQSPRT